MKLFGKEIKVPEMFAQKKRTASSREIGGSGTSIFNGMISDEEYNSELTGSTGLSTYDQMRRSDATVGAVLSAVKLPLRRAKWFVQPATDEEQDKKIAEFVEECLMEKMTITWDDFLRQSFLMLDYGHMVFEKVFQIVEVDGKEYIGWKKFAPRLPKSINKWEMDGGKDGIQQQLADGKTANIPMEKLIVFTNQREGENWDGISLLRNAYKHWYFKDNFYKIDAMSFERQGMGIPIIHLPAGHTSNDKTVAENLLKNLRANEQQYLLLPEGWEFEFADMKGKSMRDPKESILHHDRQITKSVLAQFLELGASGGSGSRAVSGDHSALFLKAEEAIARQICDVVNKYAIKQLVDMNFEVDYYPKLKFSKISNIDYEKLSGALQKLITARVVLPDDELEDYMRNEMDLPDVPEDEREDRDRTPTPPAVPKGEDMEDEEDEKEEAPTKKEKDKMEKEEKKSASETRGVKKKGSEPKKTFIPWRPLTFAEKKIDFKKIQEKIDELEKNYIMDTTRILDEASPVMLAKFKKALKAKDSKALRKLALEYKGPYRKEILRHLSLAYEFGKRGVAGEMGLAAPKTPDSEARRMIMQADMIADTHESNIIKGMKLTVINEMKKGRTVDQAINAVAIKMGKMTGTLTYNTAVITAGSLYGQGRYQTMITNKNKIHALQRSEILDSRICNFCLSMDGRIVKIGDDIAKSDIFHSGCFLPQTKVLTEKGYKEIQDIKVGEIVATHKDNWKKVYHTMAREYDDEMVEIILENDKRIICTADHEFWVDNGWVEARNLKENDDLSEFSNDKNGKE